MVMCKYLQAIFYFFFSVFLCFKHAPIDDIRSKQGLVCPPLTVEVAELPIADSSSDFQIHVFVPPLPCIYIIITSIIFIGNQGNFSVHFRITEHFHRQPVIVTI